MFFTIKKWTLLYIILMLVVVFGGFIVILQRGSAAQQVSGDISRDAGGMVLIIDPGHGGEDGGAVADDGTVESRINLSLSLQMEDLARFLGVETVMTRREDISIHDSGLETFRQRKASDLKNRTELANSVAGGVLISIHQNMLPGYPSVHGAQVFYNQAQGSGQLAAAVQDGLNLWINGEDAKACKPSDSGIYLLQHTSCPAILVECGFLSNPKETAMLRDEGYQTRLAVTILSSALGQLCPADA